MDDTINTGTYLSAYLYMPVLRIQNDFSGSLSCFDVNFRFLSGFGSGMLSKGIIRVFAQLRQFFLKEVYMYRTPEDLKTLLFK
jgi:hypothetical protein